MGICQKGFGNFFSPQIYFQAWFVTLPHVQTREVTIRLKFYALCSVKSKIESCKIAVIASFCMRSLIEHKKKESASLSLKNILLIRIHLLPGARS